MRINPQLLEKIKESLSSVLPITAIVLLLSVSIVPLTTGALVLFLFGSLLLIVGVGVFTLGVDMSMTPMGSGIGAYMSRARHMAIPLSVALVLGMLITIAEPDLTVLAEQVPAIPNQVLILTVSAGVGAFLVIALLRTILHIPLSRLLVGSYLIVFVLAIVLVPNDFIPVSFDSGGVTTGPITVPFIMALGVAWPRCAATGTPPATASAWWPCAAWGPSSRCWSWGSATPPTVPATSRRPCRTSPPPGTPFRSSPPPSPTTPGRWPWPWCPSAPCFCSSRC